jgi:hypothetical protein
MMIMMKQSVKLTLKNKKEKIHHFKYLHCAFPRSKYNNYREIRKKRNLLDLILPILIQILW